MTNQKKCIEDFPVRLYLVRIADWAIVAISQHAIYRLHIIAIARMRNLRNIIVVDFEFIQLNKDDVFADFIFEPFPETV